MKGLRSRMQLTKYGLATLDIELSEAAYAS